jgi:hypothetical protein
MADHVKIGDITPWQQTVQTVAGTTTFEFGFPIFRAEDVQVFIDDGPALTLITDYTVTGAGQDEGGAVTLMAAPEVGAAITMRRRLAIARTTDFQESGEFRANVLNDELDYQTAVIQQIANDIARSLVTAPTDPAGNLTLPTLADRKGRFWWWDNATGNPSLAAGVAGVAVSGAMEAVVAAATVAAARALMGLTIGADVEAHDPDLLRADADDVLAAGFGQGYEALGPLGAMADDTLVLTAIAGSNRKALTVDVDGEIDVTGMAAGAVLIRATNVGARSLTIAGATPTQGSGTFDGSAGAVNLLLFESDGATVDLTIDQRGA